MTYRETCILLPCHSLEDFPMHYEGQEASGLLSAWTALWHPGLLGTVESAPTWHRSSGPPADLADRLILVPSVSQKELPAGFAERAAEEGACLICGDLERDEILAQALQPLGDRLRQLDADIVADFLALGYAYLQVELLTRQMRYATNLDEIHFHNQAVAGAKAALEGNNEEARNKLHSCFDLLAQERDHYYAVDALVLDLTLLANSTLGESFQQELESGVPVNVLLTGELLERMKREAPAAFAALERGLSGGNVGLVGGEYRELRTPLFACESVLRQLRRGLSTFRQAVRARPAIYGRRRFGMTTLHPQLLSQLGYSGALHATLDAGKFPEGSQAKLRWEGLDHSTVDTLARIPLDAAKPETFLSLASKLGETMDMDHIATVFFAHWPGRVCPFYHDLRRVARYGTMLGKFVTVDEYFRDTDYAGQLERFHADQYRSPYLRQAVQRGEVDPLSRWIRYWQRQTLAETAQAMECLLSLVSQRASFEAEALLEELAVGDAQTNDDLDQRLSTLLETLTQRLESCVPRGNAPPQTGYLLFNASSFVRRTNVALPELEQLPRLDKPVYAADDADNTKYAVVDVPPMGFAWVTGGGPAKPAKRPPQQLVEDDRLFNEFFEARINRTTGAVQGIYDYERRGNRLSQQVVFRSPNLNESSVGEAAPYTVMAADSVRVTASSTVMGEITSEGRLLDRAGQTLATFAQRCQVWRGSRVLRLRVELNPRREPADDPWNSYYAWRFAWPNASAVLWRGVNQLRERAEAKRFESPSYIEIDETNHRMTLFTRGLPFHRRTDPRMIDSLLIVAGERQRTFEMGIGVNVKYPLQESLSLLMPQALVKRTAPPPANGTSSWLFHLSSRNVVATNWEPLVEEGVPTGFRVRLLETSGRAAQTKIQCYRPLASAQLFSFNGEKRGECRLEDGAVCLELRANEWTEIAARWQ